MQSIILWVEAARGWNQNGPIAADLYEMQELQLMAGETRGQMAVKALFLVEFV